MPIYGTPTYNPSGRFAFPRSYPSKIMFGFGVGAAITQSANEFYITDTTNPIVHVVCNFQPNFWPYSSNGYTLDWIIKDWWLIIDPNPAPQNLNFNFHFHYYVPDKEWELQVWLAGFTTRYTFDLPGSWSPLPPLP